MSDLLKLAGQLRESSNQQLVELLHRRTVSGVSKDFFDLAQSLLNTRSIDQALTRLCASEVAALQAIANGHSAPAAAVASLRNLALVTETNGKPEPIAAVSAQLTTALALLAKGGRGNAASADYQASMATVFGSSMPAAPDELPNQEATLGLAAIAAFETQLALTELVLDVEQHLVKQIGKTGFGVGDVKRLSTHLNKSTNAVRGYFVLAQQLQLLQLNGERWFLTSAAQDFLNASVMQRWLLIATQWVRSLGPTGAAELLKLVDAASPDTPIDLNTMLKSVFPLANDALGNELNVLHEQAQDIGFSVHGLATSLLAPSLRGEFSVAAKAVENHLPAAQNSLIVQADLSLIAPGPLDTKTEATLRKFATVEQVSVACSYRLSPLSVTHGLECGLSIEEIRDLLLELSSKPLPQPVDYLLNEVQERFGRLTILAGNGASKAILKCTQGMLLTEILNDVRVRAFAFAPLTASSIATRFDPEVLYFALRDHGYLPIRIDAAGAVISPRAKHSWGLNTSALNQDPVEDLVARLRAADQKVGSQPNDQDLLRQLQLAVKNKAQITVAVSARDGSEVEFRIVPTAVANGRVRGLDKKADIERTLPLEKILRVSF